MDNIKNKLLPFCIVSIVVIGLGIISYKVVVNVPSNPTENVIDAPLSALATKGKLAYDNNCLACHGENGAGTKTGPPFLHKVYHPGHHGDPSFVRAIKTGVKQHHWPFGDMPPQMQVKDQDIKAIIQYVRELQKANGIY